MFEKILINVKYTLPMLQQLVSCSFCNGEGPASTIREHLMICGNKTDQCPNCKKYVRRALFAYHYENECADLDESESAGNAVANRTQTFSTFQPNYPPPSSLRPSAANDKNIKIRTVDLATFSNPQTVPTSQQSNSGRFQFILFTVSIVNVFKKG
jgi:hypothetical protein